MNGPDVNENPVVENPEPEPTVFEPRRRVTVHGPPPVIGEDGFVKEAPVPNPEAVNSIQPSRRRVTLAGPAPTVYADGTVGPSESSSEGGTDSTTQATQGIQALMPISRNGIPEEISSNDIHNGPASQRARRVTVAGSALVVHPDGTVATAPSEEELQQRASWAGLGSFLQRQFGPPTAEPAEVKPNTAAHKQVDNAGSLTEKLTTQLKTMNEPFKDHRKLHKGSVKKAGACRVRRSDLNVWAPQSM